MMLRWFSLYPVGYFILKNVFIYLGCIGSSKFRGEQWGPKLGWTFKVLKMLVLQPCPASWDPIDCSSVRLLCPQHSPGKNTRVGSHSLLQGIFPIQGSNPRALPLQADSLPSKPSGKPPKLRWCQQKWKVLGILGNIHTLNLHWAFTGFHKYTALQIARHCNTTVISVKVKSLSRIRLCDPTDCSLPGSCVHGLFQAIVLEWISISFSRGIFPTQGSNPGLPHCRQTPLSSEPPGKS